MTDRKALWWFVNQYQIRIEYLTKSQKCGLSLEELWNLNLFSVSTGFSILERNSLEVLQIAVALTVIITFLLYVRLTGKFPSSSLVSEVPDQVWFTNKFRHTIPDTMEPSIALWNQDANPKG